MRPIPITDPTDHENTDDALDTAQSTPSVADWDPHMNTSMAIATAAVTLFWFAVVTSLLWLASLLSAEPLHNAYAWLAGAFAMASICLFALAVEVGRDTKNLFVGLSVFVLTLTAVMAATWLGALVQMRWVVVPISYGVGLYVTRRSRGAYSMPWSRA